MLKFNGGAGAVICDGCRTMLVDGNRVLNEYRTMDVGSVRFHYCGAGCMSRHAGEDDGLKRGHALVLATEAATLRSIEGLRSRADDSVIGWLQDRLVSRPVKPPV